MQQQMTNTGSITNKGEMLPVCSTVSQIFPGQLCWAVLGNGETTASREETLGYKSHGAYSLMYHVTFSSEHVSEPVSALSGNDSSTFKQKGIPQGTGSTKITAKAG